MVDFQIVSRGIRNKEVLSAMRSIPRECFVPDSYVSQAYDDKPLPIGYHQTISQPFMVAWMSLLLEIRKGDRIFEIGTGSGYQSAVLIFLERSYSPLSSSNLFIKSRFKIWNFGARVALEQIILLAEMRLKFSNLNFNLIR